MRFWWFLLSILAGFLLSSTVFSFLQVWGVKPDLVIVLIIINGFLYGPREGALWGFAGGILQDFLSGGYLGMHALAGMAAGWLAAVAGNRFYRDNAGVLVVSTFLVSFAAGAVNYLLLLFLTLFLSLHVSPEAAFGRIVPLSSAYNALAALPMARLFPGFSRAPRLRRTRF